MKIGLLDKSKLPRTGEEYLELIRSADDSIVRSAADIDDLAHVSPFDRVSPDALAAFKKSLIFKHRGLAHANYSVLAGVLDDAQVLEAFAWFGLSETLFRDWQDKQCSQSRPATCEPQYGDVCTSNC